MMDFHKKYEYHFIVHLRNKEKLKILYLTDIQYVDEALQEFIGNKQYEPINLYKKGKLVPGYLNLFDVEYIEVTP